MVNFWNSVFGFLLLVLGITLIVLTTKKRKKDFDDVYGNYISIYTGEILIAMAGLALFLRELLKLV